MSGRRRYTPEKHQEYLARLSRMAGQVWPGAVPVINSHLFRCRVPGLRASGKPRGRFTREDAEDWLLWLMFSWLVPLVGLIFAVEQKTRVYGSDIGALSVQWMRSFATLTRTTYTIVTAERVAVAVKHPHEPEILWQSEIDRMWVVGSDRRALLWLDFPDGSRVAIPIDRDWIAPARALMLDRPSQGDEIAPL